MFVRKKSAAAAAALLLASLSASASVTLQLQYNDGIALRTVTCSAATASCVGDNTAAFTFVAGVVTGVGADVAFKATNWYGWNFGGPGFVNISAASGNMPGAAEARLSLSNFSLERTGTLGSGALNFNVVGQDYFMPAAPAKSFIGSSSMTRYEGPNLSAASSQFTRFFGDSDPAGFPTTVLDSCTGVIGTDSNDRSCSVAGTWNDGLPAGFSLRLQQQITLMTGESVQSQGSLTTVARIPEPMTLSLVSLALLGAGIAARRRSNKA
jgi:hypothetical protein